MKKKAQGISVNVIIIAAIALIVLVVLVAVFTGNMGDWALKLRAAGNKYCGAVPADVDGSSAGGAIASKANGCGKGKIEIYGTFKDIKAGQICCQP